MRNEDKEQQPAIAVLRVCHIRDLEDMIRLTGSRIEKCVECGEDVLVAPSTDEALVNGWPLVCLECLGVSLDEAAQMITREGLTPAQQEEAKLVEEYYRNRN